MKIGNGGIKVEGHYGTWYVVDQYIDRGKDIYLLEHEDCGDEAACVIVDKAGNLLLDNVWNGLNDYFEKFGR